MGNPRFAVLVLLLSSLVTATFVPSGNWRRLGRSLSTDFLLTGRSVDTPAYCNDGNSLVSLLQENRLQCFCKSYIDYKPGTIHVVTSTKQVTATTCAAGNIDCIPMRVTPTFSRTVTDVRTVTVDGEGHTVLATATPTTTLQATVFSTSKVTVTETYTIGSPRRTDPVRKRSVSRPDPPSRISSCPEDKISKACSSLIVPTTTSTVTSTVTVEGTVDVVTGPAQTVTATATQFQTSVIPGTTTTITITAPAQTQLATLTENVTVTETKTQSICPSVTTGVFAIGIVYNGDSADYAFVNNVQTEADCCAACFDNRGCFGWFFQGTSCTFVYGTTQANDPTKQCPVAASLILPAGDGGVGGKGPCFSS